MLKAKPITGHTDQIGPGCHSSFQSIAVFAFVWLTYGVGANPAIMRTFYVDTVLQENGKLLLEHLPFAQGDALQVFILAREHPACDPSSLRGTVLKYEQRFAPVAQSDWAAAE